MRFVLILTIFMMSACASKNTKQAASLAELPGLGAGHSIQMTALECQQAGGITVGDIGDGRIHQSGFLCQNGEPPMGTILSKTDEPIAVEGTVCCGK